MPHSTYFQAKFDGGDWGYLTGLSSVRTVAPMSSEDYEPLFLFGSPNGQVINATAAKPYVVGMGGSDTVNGNASDNVLFGDYFTLSYFDSFDDNGFQIAPVPPYDISMIGHDSLSGGDGQDVLFSDLGNDTLNGGNGDDEFSISVANFGVDLFRGGAGEDGLYLSDFWDVGMTRFYTSRFILDAAASVEDVSLGSFVLEGTGGNDIFDLTGVHNIGGGEISLLGGNDLFNGAVSKLGPASEFTQNQTSVDGGNGYDTLRGGWDLDSLFGGNGEDRLYGGDDEDLLFGGGQNDVLDGGNDSDTLYGGEGSDTLTGGIGNDLLDGGTGVDTLTGGKGNDSYEITSNTKYVIELSGQGIDQISTSLASFALPDHVENLFYFGSSGFKGTGNSLNNFIRGGSLNDTLNGGLGHDTLFGWNGQDVFVFNTALGTANTDTIEFFDSGLDKIHLQNTGEGLFNKIKAGVLTEAAFKVLEPGSTVDANDRILYNASNGRLVYDADGSGSGAGITFAFLSPNLAPTASDFLVI